MRWRWGIDPEDRPWAGTIAVLWVAQLVAAMGMSLVMPFLPLYLYELGVADADARLWAGWVGGANFLCAAVVAPLWGSMADRVGRKPMALRALVGMALAVGAMAYVQNVYQLFGLRLLQGAFGGFVPAAIALAGGIVPRERLGSALGFLQSALVGGHLIGPLLGGELSQRFGYRTTFTFTGAALITAALLVLLFVAERRRSESAVAAPGVARNVKEVLQYPALRWMLLCVLCAHGGQMLVNPQISLFVRDLTHDPEHLNRWVGLVMAAPALSSFLAAAGWGRAGDARGHAQVLSTALFGAALCVLPLAGAGALWHLLILRFMQGGFGAALNPSANSVAAHSVPENRSAAAFSLLSSAQMLGASVGPFVSGPVAAAVGVRPLFPLTAGLLALAAFAALRAARGAPGGGPSVE